MANIIQDVMVSIDGYDFSGDPVNGVDRLVTTFAIIELQDVTIQDSYTSEVTDIIQDVIG